jgi:hypothetical protein
VFHVDETKTEQPTFDNVIRPLPTPTRSKNAIEGAAESFNGFLLLPRNLRFVHGRERYPAVGADALTGFLGGLLILLVGGFFALQFVLYTHVLNDGKLTQATVISRRWSSGKSTSYYLTFQYQVSVNDKKPQSYTYEQQVGLDSYNRYLEGSKVSIKYLPDSPNEARLAGADQDSSLQFGMLFGAIMMGFFATLMFGFCVYPTVRDWNMAEKGHLVYGQLLGCSGQMTSGKNRYFKVSAEYTFQSPTTGQLLHGRQDAARNDLKKQPLPHHASPVAILYVDDQHFRMM